MKIALASIFVQDQSHALRFYSEILGFQVKHDIPMGEFRWLTVVAAGGDDGMELVLEPDANPASKAFQQAIREQGIPATAFVSEDLDAEYALLVSRGVQFKAPPADAGPVRIAVFDDTCGNWIQLFQVKAKA